MGGMVAQSLARTHPKLVRRLVLCATAPGDGKAVGPSAEVLGQLTGGSVVSLFGLLFPAGQEANGSAYAADLAKYPNVMPQAPAAVTSRQFGASATWLVGQDPTGRRQQRIRQRTLVAGGKLDRLLPLSNQQHLAKVIPHARLVSYPDAAHGFLSQDAAEFVSEVARFLR